MKRTFSQIITLVVAVFLAASLALSCASSAPGPRASKDGETPSAPGSAGAPASTEAAKPADKPSAEAPKKDGDDFAAGTRGDSAGEPELGFADSSTAPAPSGAPPSSYSEKSAGGATRSAKAAPAASGLRAGFSDDNAQFNYFVHFLEEYGSVPHHELPIGERITLAVKDSAGKPVAGANVTVTLKGKPVESGLTYSNGNFRLYPAGYPKNAQAPSYDVRVEARDGSGSTTLAVLRDGPRTVDVKLPKARAVQTPLPLDVLFVMDTTGSMGEEIERLRSTIEIINANVGAMKPKPATRFGLVLYRDVEDAYVTKLVPFTADLDAFQEELNLIDADGGGDTPEDLQSALDDAVRRMAWNQNGIRLAFVVTDADAQLGYANKWNFAFRNDTRQAEPVSPNKPWKGPEYTYADAARDAKAKAIKFYTIGTGGLPLEGEYVLRQLSQYTDAKYIFLTYGEAGEAAGGREGSVSHHTGTNFSTDKLEAVVMRFVREELAFQSDTPIVVEEDYFDAKKIEDEERDKTLELLFTDALKNLVDYSTYKIGADTPCVVLPVTTADAAIAPTAEYFGERILLIASSAKLWKPVDRKNLQAIVEEIELQVSGLFDEANAAQVGELLGAEVLVVGNVYKRADKYELFLKLVRVETAEVLAVSRAKIDVKLGL